MYTFPDFPASEEQQRHYLRYMKFIATRPCRALVREKGYAIHHVTPRSMKGTNASNNLIKLTYREHFIAHLILWKCGYPSMISAFWLMSNKYSLTASMYTSIREAQRGKAKQQIKEMWDNLSDVDKICRIQRCVEGVKNMPKEIRDNMLQKQTNSRIGRSLSPEWKIQISNSLLGHSVTETTKAKIRNTMQGRIIEPEWREKISDTLMGRYTGGMNPHAKKVICIELNQEFSSIAEAAVIVYGDKKHTTRIQVSLRKHRAVCGHTWEYAQKRGE